MRIINAPERAGISFAKKYWLVLRQFNSKSLLRCIRVGKRFQIERGIENVTSAMHRKADHERTSPNRRE